jgi:ankyrin repeat protein
MTDPESLKTRFKELVEREDAPGLLALLGAHQQVRGLIDEPLFSFGKPAVVCARNNLPLLDVLLEFGANINARSQWEPGSYGVLNETDTNVVDALLKRGAEWDIHAAVEHNRTEVVLKFLDDEQAVHRRGPDGQLPLHYAQDVEMAKRLLSRGAEIDARCLDHDSTAAEYMVCDRSEVCLFLIEQGCQTDIFMACALGHVELADYHLGKDPDCLTWEIGKGRYDGHIYNWKLPAGTPYRVALAQGRGSLAEAIFHRLPPRRQFLAACWAAKEDRARELLTRHPEFLDNLGEDARLVADAAWAGKADAVAVMLKLGFPVDSRGDHRSTPLDRACVRGDLAVVESVLPFGPDLQVENEFGGVPLTTALWGACYWREGDYEKVVERLMQQGAPGHLRDQVDRDKGYGFLVAWMVDEGPFSIIETLLRNGAPATGRNRDGESALEVARRKGREDVLKLLRSYIGGDR